MTLEQIVTAGQATQLALEHHRSGRYREAEDICRQLLNADPSNFDALHFLGVMAHEFGRHSQAVDLIRQAISVIPADPFAHNNLGAAHGELGGPEIATTHYQRALELRPDFAEAHFNLALALEQQGNRQGAVDHLSKALGLKPDYLAAYSVLGRLLNGQSKLNDAISCLRIALRLLPDSIETINNLGSLFKEQGRLDLAIDYYRRALELAPAEAVAHHNLGVAVKEQGKLGEAIECFHRALMLKPDFAEALWSFHVSHLAVIPGSDDRNPVDRTRFDQHLAELELWFDGDRLTDGYNTVAVQQPFYLAYQEEDNREVMVRYGKLCNRLMSCWQQSQGIKPANLKARGRISVGVVSKHICNHSVWNAILKGWIQHLDIRKFSLHIFYLGSIEDGDTRYARSKVTSFAAGKGGLRQWADCILEQEIEVLIYPEIGMDPLTARLANLRLAPIQAATWGHPETTGLPTIDYYLSAEGFEPRGAEGNYLENLVKLPNLGCCYLPLDVPSEELNFEALGIDWRSPVLICPGTPFKYAPQHDWVFPEIARRLGWCQFVFFTSRVSQMSEFLYQRLSDSFARAGMRYEEFVVSIPWQPLPAFFDIMRRADVYLDTIGFSGFNTAMQAIECGLPIVAREGRFMRGRFASGILKQLGLSELVASSEEEYVDIAVRLVQDLEYHQRIRHDIVESRHVLFDDGVPIRALEEFLMGVTRPC